MPFHLGQTWAWESERRTVAMIAGTQGGKTGFGPWWLAREIDRRGRGDYLAVTAVYDLFKLRMLPALRLVFENLLPNVGRDDGLTYRGRYWAGDKVMEICDPETGEFLAKRSDDLMWARIILRSADAKGGLEAGTVKGAWLDEAGQDRFDLAAYKGIVRRRAIHRARELITTTLYNLGWVKTRVIDPAEDGGTVEHHEAPNGAELDRTDNEGADVCLLQYDSTINPSYPMEEFEKARGTEADDEFEMLWRGRVTTLRTLIYNSFDAKEHTCPRFEIPSGWKRYWGMDYGPDHTAVIYYAEDPGTGKWYGYREYLDGEKTIREHVEDVMDGERGLPDACYGGSKSEKQWRRECAAAGLPVKAPAFSDVWMGIRYVYACHKRGEIIYFDDLHGIIDEKGRYKKKKDREGNPIAEIAQKRTFHRLDAERYIVGYREHGPEGWVWRA